MRSERVPSTPEDRDRKRLEQLWERDSAVSVALTSARRWRTVQAVLLPVSFLLIGCVAPLLVAADGRSWTLFDLLGSAADRERRFDLTEGQLTFSGLVLWSGVLLVVAAVVAAVRLVEPPNLAWAVVARIAASGLVVVVLVWLALSGDWTTRDSDDTTPLTIGTVSLALGAVWLLAATSARRHDL